MHYATLIAIGVPPLEPDPQTDQLIAKQLAALKQAKENQSSYNPILDIQIEHCNNLQNTFSRHVNQRIASILEPYCTETENPDYLEFYDKTEELTADYESDTIPCIKLAEGRIVSCLDNHVYDRFTICNGKVFECNASPLKHQKRTKSAKRMTALPDFPVKKFYSDFKTYAEDYCGYSYYEEQKGYGYYYNPNAFYDWYSVGGRWSQVFLVKEDCPEFSVGESSPFIDDADYESPSGYKWVCAARKEDIEWQLMKDWNLTKAKACFKNLKKLFTTGEREKGIYGNVTEDGILLNNQLIYRKEDSESSYLERNGHNEFSDYPLNFYGYFVEGEWLTRNDPALTASTDSINHWRSTVSDYVDSLADDTVLVSVDCHI